MIFQEPMTSLNPVFTIGNQIEEVLELHQSHLSPKERHLKAIDMLRLVGIPSPEKRVEEYPHQLSGGMRQRVMIAIALSCEPDILIADEPTTALDVTIQAQILELMKKLQKELGMGIILITHDLGVVAETCDDVAVMYCGQIVESADVKTLFRHPKHPYTKGLMNSIPSFDSTTGGKKERLQTIEGMVPSLFDLPKTHVKFEFVEGDINDIAKIKEAMKGIDIVIHLASVTDAPSTINNPELTHRGLILESSHDWLSQYRSFAVVQRSLSTYGYKLSPYTYGQHL